jgi:hypothetical protein
VEYPATLRSALFVIPLKMLFTTTLFAPPVIP